MHATLIEIEHCPVGYRYSHLAGQRFWARSCSEAEERDCWVILPGQGEHTDTVVLAEHAWQIQDGQVELVLQVVGLEPC